MKRSRRALGQDVACVMDFTRRRILVHTGGGIAGKELLEKLRSMEENSNGMNLVNATLTKKIDETKKRFVE